MQEKALELARPYLNKEDVKSIIVTFPDQAVYLNNTVSRISEHCSSNGLSFIIVKGEAVSVNLEEESPKGKKK
jgi:hypothetical protein